MLATWHTSTPQPDPSSLLFPPCNALEGHGSAAAASPCPILPLFPVPLPIPQQSTPNLTCITSSSRHHLPPPQPTCFACSQEPTGGAMCRALSARTALHRFGSSHPRQVGSPASQASSSSLVSHALHHPPHPLQHRFLALCSVCALRAPSSLPNPLPFTPLPPPTPPPSQTSYLGVCGDVAIAVNTRALHGAAVAWVCRHHHGRHLPGLQQLCVQSGERGGEQMGAKWDHEQRTMVCSPLLCSPPCTDGSGAGAARGEGTRMEEQ
ncbi:unnamed protein product [Closterium sp. NIES-64]|nr:unnamed protein product [Closterium sp. NIES-64]CAI6005819.1 unnamed protein product [Closterium sp. NIES-65]